MIRSSLLATALFASILCVFLCAAATDCRADDEDRKEGLIGLAVMNGEPTQIAYHYPHGELFPPDLIRLRFHDGEKDLPSVRIELVGYVDVPEETQVDVYHAAGGVNGDHGTLYVDGRLIGQVGDDTVKVVIYSLTLPEGTHEVRWELTGGLFQPNILKFQDANSGKLLSVFHTTKQSEETGAAKARTLIEAKGKVAGWPPAESNWTRVATDKE
jgi:hypothetical protein